jgi:ESX secretion-associated protein EspB
MTSTEPQTLTVDYDELMQRADEIEAPVPGLPTEDAQAPCLLDMAIAAAQQLGLSATNMRTYLRTGVEREWPKLADTIRSVAKAYEEVDESAAMAITNETSVAAATYGSASDDLDAVVLTDTQVAQSFPPAYQDLKQRAWDIEHTDRGASLDNFAALWSAYRRTLLETVYRFRPFDTYDGDAAYALEQQMDKQRQWVYAMADACQTMIAQAQDLASTQRWALTQHILWDEYKLITYDYLVEFEELYEQHPEFQSAYMEYYLDWQTKSDEVIDEYQRQAALPLLPINPTTPPYVQAPPEGGSGGGSGGGTPDYPNGANPSDTLPSPSGAARDAASSAATPDTTTDQPPADPSAYPPAPLPASSTGAGVKPASFSGGGMPSMPALPLEPAIDAGAAPRPSGAGPMPGLVGASTGGRGAMGGAGGGGMPMGGHGGQNQNDKKGKRIQQEEEAIYTEDRPWTAPVIGKRRRNDLPEGECPPVPAAS